MVIREFAWSDYPAVSALWQQLGMWKPAIDSPGALATCLERNAGLFLVAIDPAHPGIAGTVIGTFDGRRGYLYHVAVAPACRRAGHGRALVEEAMRRLWAQGAAKIMLRVHRENEGAIAFYRRLGLLADERVLNISVEREV